MSDPSNDPPLVIRPPEGEELPPAPVPAKPVPGFWEAVAWCVIFLAGQMLGLVVTAVVVFTVFALSAKDPKAFTDEQLNGLKRATEPDEKGESPPIPTAMAQSLASGLLAAQFVSLGMILLVLPRRIGPDWKRQIGVRRPHWLHVVLVLLVLPGFLVVPEAIQGLVRWVLGLPPQAVEGSLKGLFAPFPWPLALLAVAIGPGVVEEFWFRGFLGRGLCARYGIVGGMLLTSVMFGVVHLDPVQVTALAGMGAYLHFVYFVTRSIWPGVLLHALNNGAAIMAALTLPPEVFQRQTPIIVPLAGFAVLLFGTVALWTSRAVEEPILREDEAWYESDGWKPEYPGISAPPPGVNVRLAHEMVSPVALIFTALSFVALIYLSYRFLI